MSVKYVDNNNVAQRLMTPDLSEHDKYLLLYDLCTNLGWKWDVIYEVYSHLAWWPQSQQSFTLPQFLTDITSAFSLFNCVAPEWKLCLELRNNYVLDAYAVSPDYKQGAYERYYTRSISNVPLAQAITFLAVDTFLTVKYMNTLSNEPSI